MTKHELALVWARAQVGKREVPPGSNTGPFVRECQAATWLGGTHWPWCCGFWLKAWRQAGYKFPYLGAGAWAMLDWYRTHLPSWVVPIERAKPGAAVIWSFGSGHCSMLARPYTDTKPMVHTVDGNVSDMVATRVRPVSLVRGVVDPPEKIVGVVKPAKKPVYEVVGSENGHAVVVYVSGAKAISRKLDELLRKHGKLTIRRRKK
jgi:hypothetical protein